VQNWNFDVPFHKILPVLVILVPLMIDHQDQQVFFEEIWL
jgi:hypothetical protein